MENIISKEEKLRKTVEFTFSKLKNEFYKNNKIEEIEDDNPPFILTLRDIVESAPPSIQAIEVINELKPNSGNTENGFLIKYDFSKLNSNFVEYCGQISNRDKTQMIKFVKEKFNLDKKNLEMLIDDICTEFSPIGVWESDDVWYLYFIKGDIIEEPNIFFKEWEKMVIFHRDVPILSDKFRRDRFENFNQIYGLESDPILSIDELIKPDSNREIFNYDIKNLQERISHIQLIPTVPKEIKTVFRRAKELFLFGYFRYDFFTISEHYAFLGLEAAMKTCFVKSLGENVVLTDKKNKEIHQTMKNRSFYDLENFGRTVKGCSVFTLLVNGEAFPYTGKKLVGWLEKKHMIKKYEKGNYEAGLQLRNSFSHLERPSTMWPDSKMLYVVANQINYMFYKKNNLQSKN